jgi:ERCC4-type nuclease
VQEVPAAQADPVLLSLPSISSLNVQILSSIRIILRMIIIDNRERHLIPLLPTTVQVQTLPVGDIWFQDASGTVSLILERKTIKDLEASVLDGRYRDQKGRLLALCEERGAQPLYLLEGPYSSTTGRLAPTALMKIVARLQFKYSIPVLHTQNLEETASLIVALHDFWLDDPANFKRDMTPLKPTDGIHVSKKANAEDPKQFLVACLMQCPGVSLRIATALTSTFPSFGTLMVASEKEIASVEIEKRKVGPVLGKRLKLFLQ